eukprot:scaffold44178_cov21-Tisochrysis_lutea.AAC.2
MLPHESSIWRVCLTIVRHLNASHPYSTFCISALLQNGYQLVSILGHNVSFWCLISAGNVSGVAMPYVKLGVQSSTSGHGALTPPFDASFMQVLSLVWQCQRLQHPSIVPVLGASLSLPSMPPGMAVLITECQELGSLSSVSCSTANQAMCHIVFNGHAHAHVGLGQKESGFEQEHLGWGLGKSIGRNGALCVAVGHGCVGVHPAYH